jgi:hypothetical protein
MRGRKYLEAGGNCIMKSFAVCISPRIQIIMGDCIKKHLMGGVRITQDTSIWGKCII